MKINEVIIHLKEYKFKLRNTKKSLLSAKILTKHIGWSESVMIMGIDHREGRGISPPEFGVGDANANCPPQILSYRYKSSVLWPSKYAKIRFLAGAVPRTPLGELMTLRMPSSRLGRGHPSHTPPHSAPKHIALALAMRSPEFQPDLRLWF